MNPAEIAKTYYKNLGKYDTQNARRLHMAACAQLARSAMLTKKANAMALMQAPQEEIDMITAAADLRKGHSAKLKLFSDCIMNAKAERDVLDQNKP